MKKHTFTEKNNFNLLINYSDYTTLHSHDYWEFKVILEGGYLHKINNQTMLLEKNTICLIRPDDIHMIKSLSETSGHILFEVNSQIMHTQLNIIDQNLESSLLNLSGCIHFKISERTKQNYLACALMIQNNEIEKNSINIFLGQMFLNLLQDILKNLTNDSSNDLKSYPLEIQNVLNMLNSSNNIKRKIYEIINESHYSYVHLSRLFKRYMNMNLCDYFLSVKMNYAKRLLEDSQKKIIDIAEEIGFHSLGHFNIAFKKYFDITPSKYRKNWIKFYNNFEDV